MAVSDTLAQVPQRYSPNGDDSNSLMTETNGQSSSSNEWKPGTPGTPSAADDCDVGVGVGGGRPPFVDEEPKINPFHILANPDSPSAQTPLPAEMDQFIVSTNTEAGQGPKIVYHDTSKASKDPRVHISKVGRKAVEVMTGPAEGMTHRKVMQKVTKVFKNDSNGDETVVTDLVDQPSYKPRMQGPPPSPPPSEPELEETEGDETTSTEGSDDEFETPAEVPLPPTTYHRPSYTGTLTAEPTDMGSISSQRTPSPSNRIDYFDSSSRPSSSGAPHLSVPSRRRVSNSSNSSRTGSLAMVRASRAAQQKAASEPLEEPPATAGEPSTQTQDVNTSPRPTISRLSRRVTNPALPSTAPPIQLPRNPLQHSQSSFAVPQSPTQVFDASALDPDILAQQDVIRRERLERRRKRAEAEAASPVEAQVEPPKPDPRREKEREDSTKVLVGNLIGEDHVNYILMYNMLTGIRIGVSRCQAKLQRPVTDEDYTAKHKFSFDIVGNELTPSARYDFKFKDYAPWIFRDLRDEHFHLDPADYLLSLTAKYILSELGSPGKSGSFFYFSRDYRFIIKTISHSEHKFLRSILRDYHEHVKSNPHTLLSRFYGLHRVKLPRGRKIHFVIMNNLFPPHRDIHETYDLKGSAYGREYPEEKAKMNPRAVLKDKNWVNRGRKLELGPEKRALFSEQLRRDMEFLKRVNVMDYSLLVGIHNMERGNRDNLRETQLSVFHPEVKPVRRKPSAAKPPSEASNIRRAVKRSDPKMLDVTSQLPADGSADRRHFLFYQDEGGLRATDEANQDMDVIYYLGIIDICTPYNTIKKLEHFWKSMTENNSTISCVNPVFYGKRFLDFLYSIMRGGDISLRPPGLMPDEDKEQAAVGTHSHSNGNAQAHRGESEAEKAHAARHEKENGIIPEESNGENGERDDDGPQMLFGYGEGHMAPPKIEDMDNIDRPAMVGHLKAD